MIRLSHALAFTGIFFTSNLFAAPLQWDTAGPGAWQNVDSWLPKQIPVAVDDLTFTQADAVAEDLVIIGGGSVGNTISVSDGAFSFQGFGSADLTTGGLAVIDDPTGTSLSTGTSLTLTTIVPDGVSWINTDNTIVGDTGYGRFTVSGSADFETVDLIIGDDAGSEGEVVVDGSSSSITSTSTSSEGGITVGNFGTGTLRIQNGGLINIPQTTGSPDLELGFEASGVGVVEITGVGSEAIIEDLVLGRAGLGILNITAGGVLNQNVNDAADAFIGNSNANNTVTVDGDGSTWNVRRANIGNNGTGRVSITGGGVMNANDSTTNNGDVVIANLVGSNGKMAVSGSGTNDSLLTVDDRLLVGDEDLGILNIGRDINDNEIGSGDVNVGGDVVIGNTDTNTATGNRLTASGADVDLTVGGFVRVGVGSTGTLEILNGATANITAGFFVGQNATGNGTVLIDGAATTVNTDSIFAANAFGGQADITISGGANVNLSRPESTAQNSAALTLGDDGNATNESVAVMTVTGNGTVLNMNGAGADAWVGGSVNDTGGSGVLNITSGALVNLDDDFILGNGDAPAVSDGQLNVSGSEGGNASRINIGDRLIVGNRGTSQLNITNGGEVFATTFDIANLTGSDNSSAIVSGTGSLLDISGSADIGDSETGTMTVENGATVNSGTAANGNTVRIGNGAAADDSSLTINNATWLHRGTGDFSVGYDGGDAVNPALLTIENGGLLTVERILVGDHLAGEGLATVTGVGSRLDARNDVFVGDNNPGSLNVLNGGVVEAADNIEIGAFDGGDGTVLVSGVGSELNQLGTGTGTWMRIADAGGSTSAVANAELTIENGGTVNAGGEVQIAFGNGSTADVNVNADGTFNAGSMYVGGASSSNPANGGGVATLNVFSNGLVDVAGEFSVEDEGTVNLNGGTIEAASLNIERDGAGATDADFNFNSGTFRFSAGALLDANTIDDLLSSTATLSDTTGIQELAVVGAATLDTNLRLDGGTFSVGSIDQASVANLDVDAGVFNLTASDLTVGVTGQFGNNTSFNANTDINVTNGDINVENGAAFSAGADASADNITNNGDMVFTGDEVLIDNSGNVTNNDQLSIISVDGTTSNFGQDINTVNNGDISSLNVTLINDGDLLLNDVNLVADVQSQAGSSITVIQQATIWNLSGSIDIFGPGTLSTVFGINPGNSPGLMFVETDLTLENTSTNVFEIAGLSAIEDYDQLQVGETLTLGGVLEVALLDDFMPEEGNTFDIIIAGLIQGNFDNIILPSLQQGLEWMVNRSSTELSLSVTSAVPIPAAIYLFAPLIGFIMMKKRTAMGASQNV